MPGPVEQEYYVTPFVQEGFRYFESLPTDLQGEIWTAYEAPYREEHRRRFGRDLARIPKLHSLKQWDDAIGTFLSMESPEDYRFLKDWLQEQADLGTLKVECDNETHSVYFKDALVSCLDEESLQPHIEIILAMTDSVGQVDYVSLNGDNELYIPREEWIPRETGKTQVAVWVWIDNLDLPYKFMLNLPIPE